jgi:DNA polymerase III subunit gamma/tau
LAKCLNCEAGMSAQPCGQCSNCLEIDSGRAVDLIEVDAASRTKVEDTRDLLDNVQYAPTKGRFKIYLIDEVHMLSSHSFNALLKTLEEPPAHVKFLLATTDPQRLPATILSRCLQFHLLAMPPEQISAQCLKILANENIECEPQAALLIAQAAEGSMRDALSLLDQSIAFGNGKVLTAEVKTMLGTIDTQILYQILHTLAAQDGDNLLSQIGRLGEQGADFSRALADLLSLLHQIAVIQAVPNGPTHLTDPELVALSKQISREDVQLYYQIGLLGQRDLPWAPTPRSGFEMTLLRMLAFIPQDQTLAAPAAAVSLSATKPAQPKSAGVAAEKHSAYMPEGKTSPMPGTTDSTPNWHELLPKLGLDGAAKMLASHCVLQELTESQLQLRLHTKQKPLLSQKQIDRIREAVSKYYGRAIAVAINVDDNAQETPATLSKRQQESQQQAAEQAIFSDPVVQHMIQNFDATVIKESIHGKSGEL